MFVIDILLALVVSALLTSLFYVGRAGRWATVSSVLIGVVCALWLRGIWLPPAGPVSL